MTPAAFFSLMIAAIMVLGILYLITLSIIDSISDNNAWKKRKEEEDALRSNKRKKWSKWADIAAWNKAYMVASEDAGMVCTSSRYSLCGGCELHDYSFSAIDVSPCVYIDGGRFYHIEQVMDVLEELDIVPPKH